LGQDVRENFVRCDTYLDSLGLHRTVAVQWFDGLGRPTVSATDGLSADGTDAVWGGDISGTVDEYAHEPEENGWDIPNTLTTGYRYDALGRMTESVPGDAAHSHAEKVTYDANGNITTLKRRGMYAPAYYSLIDDLAYRYEGNRLIGITDSVPYIPYVNEFGFRSGGEDDGEYEYNSDGAMTRDPYKGVSVSYSRRGTPKRAKFDSGSFTDWEYTADGVRLGTRWHTAVTGARGFAAEAEEENTTGIQAQNPIKAHAEAAGTAQPSPQAAPIYGYVENSEEFAGNYVFEDGKLSKYLFDGGYIDIASGLNTAAYRFYVRDHLGSVRVVLDDDGNVLQQLYYHPFGGVWGDAGTNTGLQPWKYSGKEYDHRDGLDLYDYGARLYDPAAVRWTSPDPLCERHYNISPYAFCNNNPINNIDPDGRDWYKDVDGTYQFNPGVNSQEDLKKGQTYIGKEFNLGGVKFRLDGSILYSNETSAYLRMWGQADVHYRKKEKEGRETAAFLLEDGRVIVLPDYANDDSSAGIDAYGYSIVGKKLRYGGSVYKTIGMVHTHQNRQLNSSPSYYLGDSYGDLQISLDMGGNPVFTIGHDGRIYGIRGKYGPDAPILYNIPLKGFLGSRSNLLRGKTKISKIIKSLHPLR